MFKVYATIGPRTGRNRKTVSIFDPAIRELTIHNAKVTQEIGKAGSFQFVLPPTNEYYNDIQKLLTTIVVEYEVGGTNFEIFRGRVFSISTDFMKMKNIVCEGTLAYLVDSVQKATSYKGSAKKLLRKILSNHNKMMLGGLDMQPSEWSTLSEETKRKLFRLRTWDSDIEDAEVIIPGPKDDDDAYNGAKYAQAIVESIDDEWLTTYDFINDVIIDYLGGYLIASYDSSTGANYLDLRSDDSLSNDLMAADSKRVRQIDYGSNLLDLSKEFNPEDLCTIVIPLGDSVDDKVLTIEKSSIAKTYKNDEYEVVEYGGKKIAIASKSAVQKYGRIYKTHSFSDVNDANTLFNNGLKWLKKNKKIIGRYTVKAIDMRFFDSSFDENPIRLGQMISIRSGQHDLDSKLLCTKIEYDLGNPANNAYTLGNPEQTLTERYLKDKKKEDKKSRHRSSRSGGPTGTAADAAQETVDEVKDKLKDAEIVVDPDNAQITLRAWYKMSENAMRKAGIDIDGEKGRVDIYAMNAETKEQATKLASVEVWITDEESVVDLLSKHDTETSSALAELTLRTTDLESIIEQLASYESETSVTTAGITARADATEASIDSLVEFRDKATEDLISMAQIKTLANANAAEIKLLAQHHTATEAGLAKLKVRVDDTMSLVEQLATWVSDSSITTASISTKADANGASIDQLTEFKDKATGELLGLAETKQWVDKYSANIEHLTEWFGKNGTTSLTKIAQISNEKLSQILAATKFYTENSEALTSIKQLTTDKLAEIKAAATFVNKRDENGNTISTTIAGTSAVADKHKALWSAFAEWTDDDTGKLVSGSIKIKATALGSTIDMKADDIKMIGKNIRLISEKGTFLNNVFFGSGGVYIGKNGKDGTTINLDVTGSTMIEGGLEVKGGDAVVFHKPLKIYEDKEARVAATQYWVSNKNYLVQSDLTGYFKTPGENSTINWKTNALIAKNYKSKGGSRVLTRSDLDEYLKDYVKKSDYNDHKHSYTYKNGTMSVTTSTDKPSKQL